MSITNVLSRLGYSKEFIQVIEKSVLDEPTYDGHTFNVDHNYESYDSTSCYIEESNAPVIYSAFSNTTD